MAGRFRRIGLGKCHDEALGSAACFHELAKLDLDDVEAVGFEPAGERCADAVEDQGVINVDDVAGEASGLLLSNGNALFRWVEGLDAGE